MSLYSQYAEKSIVDFPYLNTSGLTLNAGTGVLRDTTATTVPSMTAPTASGGQAHTNGVLIDTCLPGKIGRVCKLGWAVMTADGSIAAGDTVEVSDTSGKLGFAKTGTTVKLGTAETAANDGEPVLVYVNPQQ